MYGTFSYLFEAILKHRMHEKEIVLERSTQRYNSGRARIFFKEGGGDASSD